MDGADASDCAGSGGSAIVLYCIVLYGVVLLCSGYTTGRDASTNQDATCNYGTVYNMHANERDDINECTRSLLQLKKEPE